MAELCNLLKSLLILELRYLLTSLLGKVEEAKYVLQIPALTFVCGWLVLIDINTANSIDLLAVVIVQSLSCPAGPCFSIFKGTARLFWDSFTAGPPLAALISWAFGTWWCYGSCRSNGCFSSVRCLLYLGMCSRSPCSVEPSRDELLFWMAQVTNSHVTSRLSC